MVGPAGIPFTVTAGKSQVSGMRIEFFRAGFFRINGGNTDVNKTQTRFFTYNPFGLAFLSALMS